MKNWPAGLITLLGTRSFVFVDLYTFTLVDGTVLRYTTGQMDVVVSGNTFSAGVLFVDDLTNKSQAHWKVGLDTDTWVVYMMPPATDPVTGAAHPATIYGQPWLAAVTANVLGGATVQIDRGYWAVWPAAAPTWTPTFIGDHVFLGRVATVDVMRQRAILTINSHLELMTTLSPVNLYQAPCIFTLFDAGCTLSQAAFQITGNTVTNVGPGVMTVNFSGAIPGSGTLALGQVLFTSGANTVLRRGVRAYSALGGAAANLFYYPPFPFPVVPGDVFTGYPGCDKSFFACGQFDNTVNFGTRGATVPAPETAV